MVKGLVIASPHVIVEGGAAPSRTFAAQPIANRPLVAHVVDAVRSAGADEVAIVGHPDTLAQIRRASHCPDAVEYVPSPDRTDLGGLLSAAAPFVRADPCIVHVGDGLAGQPITAAPACEEGGPDVSIFVHHTRDPRYPVSKRLEELLGISHLGNGRGGLAFAGLGLLGPGAMEEALLHGLRTEPGDWDFAALGELIAATGGRLSVGQLVSWRQYAGDPRDLLELNRMVLDRMEPTYELRESDGNRFEGRIDIHPSAYVSGSVIHGPAVIGEGAELVDSYVGPYTSIGPRVHIENAEIERSIVYEGASIRHLGVRIESSTVGPHARIIREFGLPRAMRLHVGEGVELALD